MFSTPIMATCTPQRRRDLRRYHLHNSPMPISQLVIRIFVLGITFACCTAPGYAAESIYPQGDTPPPLSGRHFPDRVHECIWRNWEAVAPETLARILGASPEDVTGVAVSMGLSATPQRCPDMLTRGYATLIRRNWHLLPYEQLLELVDMTPERLAFTLREEDFLWIKLGRLKPACEPLRFQPPDDAAKARAAEIRRVVETEFGNALQQPGEPRFDFVRQLNLPQEDFTPVNTEANDDAPLRLVYSYVAVYGDPLLNPDLNPYPDGLLQQLASAGINGVWLQGLLRDLAPGGADFPEFGAGHEQRLANLRALTERAKRYGIRVFLYINEPRSMPLSFFEHHADLRGVEEGDLAALCTSQPAVRRWMTDALAHIFGAVPELGGVYAITASENLTNCASHGAWQTCPRCKERTDADILSEVVSVLEAGVHRGNPNARVLISDWGWRGHGEAPDIIARLPKSVCLMSVSEWKLPIERGGIPSVVGEYSISSVGPGPRAQVEWDAARKAGLKTGTEIQFNNTCEIASIPYLPVMDLIAEHCFNLRASVRLDAMLIGWTMGGYPSPNFQVARNIERMALPDTSAALDALARERFGPEGAPHARKAWTLMSDGFREYPFHISVVYTAPVQCGPANLLHPASTGYKATMWGFPYDDLEGWRGPYPPEVFASQFEKVAKGFHAGLTELEAAAEKAPPERRADAVSDLRLARAAALYFQSTANQARFILARNALADPARSKEEHGALRTEIKRLLESEIDLARRLFALAREDSRIGFEPSCQYFYLPLDLVEKVVNCRWLLNHFQNRNENGDPGEH
mgnify:CR=1 FL=1